MRTGFAGVVKIVVALVVLGGVIVVSTRAGTWPGVVSFIEDVFGKEAGQVAEGIGETADGIANGDHEPTPVDISWGDWFGDDPVAAAQETLDQTPDTPATRIPDYDRDAFGPAWADVDGNGCDTRNDILARDLTAITKEGACRVLTGVLDDPYTGTTIHFQRGQATSSAVQIDHVVALSAAWSAGAWQWSAEQRLAFANDPLNLLAVDGPTNSGKSDKTPAEWLPPNDAYTCDYLMRYIAVTTKYGLTVDGDDRDVITRELADCA